MASVSGANLPKTKFTMKTMREEFAKIRALALKSPPSDRPRIFVIDPRERYRLSQSVIDRGRAILAAPAQPAASEESVVVLEQMPASSMCQKERRVAASTPMVTRRTRECFTPEGVSVSVIEKNLSANKAASTKKQSIIHINTADSSLQADDHNVEPQPSEAESLKPSEAEPSKPSEAESPKPLEAESSKPSEASPLINELLSRRNITLRHSRSVRGQSVESIVHKLKRQSIGLSPMSPALRKDSHLAGVRKAARNFTVATQCTLSNPSATETETSLDYGEHSTGVSGAQLDTLLTLLQENFVAMPPREDLLRFDPSKSSGAPQNNEARPWRVSHTLVVHDAVITPPVISPASSVHARNKPKQFCNKKRAEEAETETPQVPNDTSMDDDSLDTFLGSLALERLSAPNTPQKSDSPVNKYDKILRSREKSHVDSNPMASQVRVNLFRQLNEENATAKPTTSTAIETKNNGVKPQTKDEVDVPKQYRRGRSAKRMQDVTNVTIQESTFNDMSEINVNDTGIVYNAKAKAKITSIKTGLEKGGKRSTRASSASKQKAKKTAEEMEEEVSGRFDDLIATSATNVTENTENLYDVSASTSKVSSHAKGKLSTGKKSGAKRKVSGRKTAETNEIDQSVADFEGNTLARDLTSFNETTNQATTSVQHLHSTRFNGLSPVHEVEELSSMFKVPNKPAPKRGSRNKRTKFTLVSPKRSSKIQKRSCAPRTEINETPDSGIMSGSDGNQVSNLGSTTSKPYHDSQVSKCDEQQTHNEPSLSSGLRRSNRDRRPPRVSYLGTVLVLRNKKEFKAISCMNSAGHHSQSRESHQAVSFASRTIQSLAEQESAVNHSELDIPNDVPSTTNNNTIKSKRNSKSTKKRQTGVKSGRVSKRKSKPSVSFMKVGNSSTNDISMEMAAPENSPRGLDESIDDILCANGVRVISLRPGRHNGRFSVRKSENSRIRTGMLIISAGKEKPLQRTKNELSFTIEKGNIEVGVDNNVFTMPESGMFRIVVGSSYYIKNRHKKNSVELSFIQYRSI